MAATLSPDYEHDPDGSGDCADFAASPAIAVTFQPASRLPLTLMDQIPIAPTPPASSEEFPATPVPSGDRSPLAPNPPSLPIVGLAQNPVLLHRSPATIAATEVAFPEDASPPIAFPLQPLAEQICA